MPDTTAVMNVEAPVTVSEGVMLQAINLATDVPFEVSCVEVLPGCATPVDQHEVRECWIIAQGSGLLDYAGKKTRVQKRDVLYFQPWQQHQISNDTDETLVIYSLYW